MQTVDTLADPASFYRRFAREVAAGESECFRQWAEGVAEDDQVLGLIQGLPLVKRQPNLVFAAARWTGTPAPAPYAALRETLVDHWPAVRETILARATQTNEVGRCATLLPVLAGLPGPLALLEVGASAGLCLHPDRWSYRYLDGDGAVRAELDPVRGRSPVLLECRVDGEAPLPARLPQVVHRGGVDLNPLDLSVAGNARWLETLVWPEHEDRRVRLAAACALVADEPVDILAGDLRAGLGEAVDRARAAAPEATLVIFHSAVIAYLDEAGRRGRGDVVTAAVERVRATGGRAHWVSNEGVGVVPVVTEAGGGPPPGSEFCLALDGRGVAWTHGRRLTWC